MNEEFKEENPLNKGSNEIELEYYYDEEEDSS